MSSKLASREQAILWFALAGFALLSATNASAASVATPFWRCDPDALFASGFETAVPENPSLGSGGAVPAFDAVTINTVAGVLTYHIAVPPSYQFSRAAPLIIALHGASGAGNQALAAAAARDTWALVDSKDAVIIAPEASGAMGGWVVNTDQSKLVAAISDVSARYNIDRYRIYGWGFSAGAHVMHRFALLNLPTTFAAYGVSAGALQASAGITAPSLATRKVPLHIDQGDVDPIVPLSVVQQDVVRFQNAGWVLAPNSTPANLFFEVFPGTHEYDSIRLTRVWANLCRFSEVPQ